VARDHKAELEKAAQALNAVVVDRGHGHFQIKGALLVNYYPNAKRQTAYVAGTNRGKHFVNPVQAVALAFKPPAFRPGETERKSGGYRRVKIRLFKKQKHCHWCKAKLTLETATLEHVIPLARGGLDNDNNRVLACEPCNRKRGHSMPELSRSTVD
jgi:hypothetical protein